MLSTLGVFQYSGGCSVHRGCSVHWGDTMSTSGENHEYNGGVHRGDTMIHVGGGGQGDKSLSIYIENPDVLNIPRCTHDNLPHAP